METPETNRRAVLVSLHPRFAKAIAEGTKRVELRRLFPRVPPGTLLVVYATMPVGAVIGFAAIVRILRGSPSELWEAVSIKAGLPFDEFMAYFEGCDQGFGVEIGPYTPLAAPVPLSALRERLPSFRPPQSFRYVELPETGEVTLAALTGT
jgi:predicted transcriptional regulator